MTISSSLTDGTSDMGFDRHARDLLTYISNKMNLDNNVRSAVVRIRYNNHTCAISSLCGRVMNPRNLQEPNGEFRICVHNALASVDHDPRDEGSMFKREISMTRSILSIMNTTTVQEFHHHFHMAAKSVSLYTRRSVWWMSGLLGQNFDGREKIFLRLQTL